ncbi:MAG: chemotaxis protein CheB [Pseudooceanicola sp.]
MKEENISRAEPVREEDSEHLCIVGIGASAGGLEAIREMLTEARAESNLAYVVVQHLDPNHESLLAELLSRHTELAVRQVSGGERIQPGNVYIIPPGHGLSIRDGVLDLTNFEQPRGLRRPIDDFFESLALDQGRFAACVILSGTGADGSAGLRAIKEHGGLCIVQDPQTAKYDGMPTSAQGTGLVDFVRPPAGIVESISQFYAHASVRTTDEKVASSVEECLNDICTVVRNFVGHDFSGYKKSTLIRRVQRRLQVLDLTDANQYLQHIKMEPGECEVLFRDLLINVTRFFRDTAHFAALRQHAIQPLVRDAASNDEIRVWVPGCSSGEEAYSIAMLFAEECRLQNRNLNVQIFATDIDEQMLRLARDGTYPQASLADIPEEMREAYTIARDGRFQITARIRDMIRFSVHSIVRDPPFSSIDLLSCRNLLIYFGDGLQNAALPVFHYAIKPGGVLFLGPSEALGRLEHAFKPIEHSARIFRRDNGRSEYPFSLSGRNEVMDRRRFPSETAPARRNALSDGGATDRILSAYAPPTLRVTTAGEILRATGRLSKFLDFSQDEETNRFAPAVARPGVREPLSAITRQVARDKKRTISRGLTARSEFGQQAFDLIAEPLADGTILVVFRNTDRFEALDDDEFEELDSTDSHVQSLEDELRSTRVRLHTTVEELETANEELKSSNEEMMSMNEELQSTNEELSTVNDELKSKVDELSVANADLSNFFASTALPLVVVGRDMAIRNFTDAIQAIYPLRASDRDRPLTEVTSTLRQNDEVLDVTGEVMRDGEIRHLRVSTRSDDRTWSLVVTPYHARHGELVGATLVFTELTEALRLEEALQHEGERLRLALDVTSLGVWEYDPEAATIRLDENGSSLFGMMPGAQPVDHAVRAVHDDDRETLRCALGEMAGEGDLTDVTFRLDGEGPRYRSLQMVGRLVESRKASRVLGVLFDVTVEQEDKDVREMMLREMNHRVKNMFSIISGMIRIAGRQTQNVPDLVEGIQTRVNALARSHDMTQATRENRKLTLEDAVRASLKPYEDHAEMTLDGPELPVTSQDLTSLSLLLHEWSTNAVKYGVLGAVDGRLEVRWHQPEPDEVHLEWNEIYNDDVVPDGGRRGFGTTLIDLSAAQLNGTVTVETEPRIRRMILTYAPNS